MSTPPPNEPVRHPSVFRNWVSFAGLVLMASSIFAFLLLFFLDAVVYSSNPYVGILTFLVAPMFLADRPGHLSFWRLAMAPEARQGKWRRAVVVYQCGSLPRA